MKYNRTYHFPFSPGSTNDDRIGKNVSKLIGEEIVITEKLDGENCGMCIPGVYARSHAAFTTSAWSREVRALHPNIAEWLEEDQMIFGENMEGIHSIEYSNLESYFYLFGSRRGTTWDSWDDVECLSFYMDILTVPVLFRGVVNSEGELRTLVENLVANPSTLGGETEGCVARVARSFEDEEFGEVVMKWVRKGHVTTSAHWTRSWKKAKLISRT
jgi:hypothetical protein